MVRNAIRRRSVFELGPTCASSESSESEGICADYISKNGHSMTSSFVNDDVWTDKLASRYGQVRNLDRSIDWGSMAASSYNRRHTIYMPRSSPALSMMTSFLTPQKTRIPAPMSHSYSGTSRTLSTCRSLRATSCTVTTPVTGSREQLCAEFTDVRREARRLLERSQKRTPLRSRTQDQRCLLPPVSRMFHSLSVSPSRRRLLPRRPQLSRSGVEPTTLGASLELSMLRSGTTNPFARSRECSTEPAASGKHNKRRSRFYKSRNSFGGVYLLPMSRLVSWYRITSTRCFRCRNQQRIRRLSKHSLRTGKVSCSGISKSGVVYRSQCVCGDEKVSVPIIIPILPLSTFQYWTDWAAIFAALALFFQLILKLFLE